MSHPARAQAWPLAHEEVMMGVWLGCGMSMRGGWLAVGLATRAPGPLEDGPKACVRLGGRS